MYILRFQVEEADSDDLAAFATMFGVSLDNYRFEKQVHPTLLDALRAFKAKVSNRTPSGTYSVILERPRKWPTIICEKGRWHSAKLNTKTGTIEQTTREVLLTWLDQSILELQSSA